MTSSHKQHEYKSELCFSSVCLLATVDVHYVGFPSVKLQNGYLDSSSCLFTQWGLGMVEIRKLFSGRTQGAWTTWLMKHSANTIFLSGAWLSGASCLVSHHHSAPSQRIKELDSRHAGFLPSAASFWGQSVRVSAVHRNAWLLLRRREGNGAPWGGRKHKWGVLSESLFLVSHLDRKSFKRKLGNYWDLTRVTAAENSQRGCKQWSKAI